MLSKKRNGRILPIPGRLHIFITRVTAQFRASLMRNIRQILLLSATTAIGLSLLYCGYHRASPEDFTNQFILPASYTFLALLPGYMIVDSVGKNLTNLNKRVERGIQRSKILLTGDTEEKRKILAQLKYSNIFNIANIHLADSNSTEVSNLNSYNLIIHCLKTASEESKTSPRITDIAAQIGDDKEVLQRITTSQDLTALIVLCPQGRLDDSVSGMLFSRPFTSLVNQPGRMMTDIISLLTSLPSSQD